MKVLPWILCVVLASILLLKCGSESTCTKQSYNDTILFYDTIKYDTLIPRDSVVIKYITEKLSVVKDSISCDFPNRRYCSKIVQ